MDKWEYLTYYIKYDAIKHKNWILEFTDAPPITGLNNILDKYGEQGWELVNLVPEYLDALQWQWASTEVKGFRAVFKRRKQ